MALTVWSLLEIRSPLFFRHKSKEKGAETKNKEEEGGLTILNEGISRKKGRCTLSQWRLINEESSIFLPSDYHFWEQKLQFFHNPANMSQGKRTHQLFLQWGTKKKSLRLNRSRPIIFPSLSTIFFSLSTIFFFLNTYHSWIAFFDLFHHLL